MAISYPGGLDSFSEPTLPEDTPLASAGSATRNHVEHHRDLGDAVEAIERNASLKGHDHSGDATDTHKGAKLTQAVTHESPDTDTTSGIHHTLGTGANQAARGNHVHDYSALTGRPIIACTSTTRPSSPSLGLLIYETDTFRMRAWAQYPGDSAPAWRFLLGPTPAVRLRQGAAQQIFPAGSVMEWRDELEDAYGMFDKNASLTNVVIKEPGLYQVTATVQWDAVNVPDVAHAVVLINGVETTVRQSQFMRGNLFTPGFSQTLTVTGPLRFALNDVVTVKASFTAPGLITWLLSFFDGPTKINSRFDLVYSGP